MDMKELSVKPAHHPRIAARVFDDAAVVISPTENMVRMLNPTGSRIWELADGRRTLADIASALTREFAIDLPQACESVTAFVNELLAKELLVLV